MQSPLAKCLKITFSAWKADSKWPDPRYTASYLSKVFHLSLLSKELKHAYTWSHFNNRLFTVVDCWIGAFLSSPNYTSMHLLILFLFELKETISPEQLKCLFCYSKLCFILHRKQKLDPTWDSQYCKYSLCCGINLFPLLVHTEPFETHSAPFR